MKPSFHARLVNSPFEDPCLYVRLLRESRALVFDLGFAPGLSARDLLKITDIFVSHTHVDHFIGFDNVLRTCLRKETPLRLYGPEGFIDRVDGKLRGYTWNLIADYPLVLHVSELSGSVVSHAVFRAGNTFKREDGEATPFHGELLKDTFFSVSAAVLDHQVPCLAFSLAEDYHINIDKDKLKKMGLPVGPWLKELKDAIREDVSGRSFDIEGKEFAFTELKDVATVTKGQKIAYVVDALGSDENIMKIVRLAKGADVLYIEAYFSDKDKDRAKDRYHLTSKEAGRVAREAGAGRLEPVHFSPRYSDNPEELTKEAEEEFRNPG
ncbi:MAG: ribonuclease Z [Nitrospiraceae bacterium]|nr:MAG: ribonuclease Z [Nitrospiraceae bacterium]